MIIMFIHETPTANAEAEDPHITASYFRLDKPFNDSPFL